MKKTYIYIYPNNTYILHLHHIPKFTCSLVSHKPRRMIFSEDRHKQLFSTEKHTKVIINSIDKLYDILCENDPSSTFTYCYKSSGQLLLCKTNGKRDDMRCKHAWLCNSSNNICSSGIIMFDNLVKKIYIDNLSGTYRPKLQNLYIIQEVLKYNFQKINIQILKPLTNKLDLKKYCKTMVHSVDYNVMCKKTRKRKSMK